MNRAALVLAGGEAKRFQTPNRPWQDKALAEIEGKPFLIHILEDLKDAVDVVVVCVDTLQRQTRYRQVLAQYSIEDVEFVLDQENRPIKGPLLAITSGLQAVDAKFVLVAPVDMPFLKPQVASFLLDACMDFDMAVPMWPDGTLETLLMALKRESCLEINETLAALGRANADSIARGVSSLRLVSPLQEISRLDPELKSFININSPQDLAEPKTRLIGGPVTQDVHFNRVTLDWEQLRRLKNAQTMLAGNQGEETLNVFADCACRFKACGHYFWAAIAKEKLAEAQLKRGKNAIAKLTYLAAAEDYQKEALLYQAKNCTTLADRAMADKKFCKDRGVG